MAIRANIACVWQANAILGEGPCWDAIDERLVWVDIKGQRLHAFGVRDATQQTWFPAERIFSIDRAPSAWAPPPDQANWFVGCTSAGFSWIGLAGDQIIMRPLRHPEPDKPGNRFNDGKMGPDGRYWAGTMDDREREASGSLYAFTQTGGCDLIDAGYIVSNGPAFSPNGRMLYHTDSAKRTIYAFDLAPNGVASNRRIFAQFAEEEGHPDGMTTDRDGNLWIAMWDGACIQKLSPSAERLGHLSIPTRRPTSCAFAGQSTLFVTSAAIGLPAEDRLAGSLFSIDFH